MPPEDNPEQDVEITQEEAARDDAELDRRPLPQYKCHKVVGALKIGHVNHNYQYGTAELRPADKAYDDINVSRKFCSKHDPQDGGYYVRYADGYESFSPAKAFEDGYDLIA